MHVERTRRRKNGYKVTCDREMIDDWRIRERKHLDALDKAMAKVKTLVRPDVWTQPTAIITIVASIQQPETTFSPRFLRPFSYTSVKWIWRIRESPKHVKRARNRRWNRFLGFRSSNPI